MQTRNWNGRIAWEALGTRCGQVGEEYAACSQRVVSGDPVCGGLSGDETGRCAAAYILTGLVTKISIKRLNAAGELCPIVA